MNHLFEADIYKGAFPLRPWNHAAILAQVNTRSINGLQTILGSFAPRP
jgi:hypothetical protein